MDGIPIAESYELWTHPIANSNCLNHECRPLLHTEDGQTEGEAEAVSAE